MLWQGLREKCLHKLMTEKYKDEGAVFFTFLNYIDECFGKETEEKAKSLEDCYDWSTVMIGPNEEVEYVNRCVDNSFEMRGETDSFNKILGDDRNWADENHVTLHPSITVNNMTYTNSTGQKLAEAICSAFREQPDECELSWEIQIEKDGKMYDLSDEILPEDEDILAAMGNQERGKVRAARRWHLYILIVCVLAINIIVMLCIKRRTQSEASTQLNSQVQDAVSQYF